MTIIEVTRTIKLTDYEIWNWLVGAFEGGSNYWARTKITDKAGLRRVTQQECKEYLAEANADALAEFQEYSELHREYQPGRSYGKLDGWNATDSFPLLREMKGFHYSHQIPFLGGELTFYDTESRKWNEEKEEFEYEVLTHHGRPAILNRSSIQIGLEIMAENYPRHFNDFINQGGDAITSDVMLQCMVLRDVIFG
tara:strand:+ start:17793 stop:18380 length:588 start_codon:yes stop_codon:yes gene_type:complete